MKRIAVSILFGLATALSAASAVAQGFPSQPIRFIVSFPPGGGVDLMGRLVANALSEQIGQPVVVDNRSGAAGVVGSAAVARAAPDGYTVLVTGDLAITQAHLLGNIPYDPYKDLEALVKGATVPTSVLVRGDSPLKTMKDLLDHARANPGKVTWGTPGQGSSMHVEMELLKEHFGLDIVNVPYKGAAPIMTDTMGGQITVGAPGLPPVIGNVRSGKLRLLAVWGSTRVAVFPEVPTVSEATGVASLVGYPTWYGFLLPTGVPKDISARLEAEIVKALRNPEVTRKLAESGATVSAQRSKEFDAANRAQTAAFAAIFKKLQIK